jgi:hypothetical protein
MKPFTIRKAAQPVKGQQAAAQDANAAASKYATAPAKVGGEEERFDAGSEGALD